MSDSQVHIAALFETVAQADAARDALVAAGIGADRIVVLNREDSSTQPASGGGLWARIKHFLVPDIDAHHFAEGITRGHPLLVADVDASQHAAAVAALEATRPLDIEETAGHWRAAGWDGTHESQGEYEVAEDEEAPGNPGILSGGLVTGDYGAVGAPHGGMAADTNILRGSARVRSYGRG